MMRSENDVVPDAAPASLLISEGDATLFEELKDNLRAGWAVDFQANAGMAWVAFVYCAEAPRSKPMFTVCRWTDRLGLLAQWMDGTANSAFAFEELEPVARFILDGVCDYAEERHATVFVHAAADTMH